MCNTYPVWRFDMNKNLTLSVEDDLLDKMRVLAAIQRTSVNEMVRDFFRKTVEKELRATDRAEAWNRLFEAADAYKTRRKRREEAGGIENRIFDRELFYEEVMRERGLL